MEKQSNDEVGVRAIVSGFEDAWNCRSSRQHRAPAYLPTRTSFSPGPSQHPPVLRNYLPCCSDRSVYREANALWTRSSTSLVTVFLTAFFVMRALNSTCLL